MECYHLYMTTATAQAFPNIAFIKYWGNRDAHFRIPSNASISMNLGGLETRTQVTFDPALKNDQLTLNGKPQSGKSLERVSAVLDLVRQMAALQRFARVESNNNFPTGVGIASSASAFAALSLAASAAAGLALSEAELSRLARRGSGSACRSVPGGFVEWQAGEDDLTSYASSIASRRVRYSSDSKAAGIAPRSSAMRRSIASARATPCPAGRRSARGCWGWSKS